MSKSPRNSLTMDEILENLPSPVLIVKFHKIVWANQSFWEFYLPDEAQEFPMPQNPPTIDIYQLVKRNSRGSLREYLLSLSSLEKPFETILISSDEEYTPVLISGRCLNPVSEIEDRVFLLVCTDISDKLKSEFLLYEMLEQIDEIFFVISLENQYLQYINKRGLMLLRKNEDDIKNRKYTDFFPELNWPHLNNLIDLSTRNMMPLHDKEITARFSSGVKVYFANIIPINDFSHTYRLMLVTLREITQFRAKINLANQLEKIIQSIPDPMLIVDENLETRLINHATVNLRGINPLRIKEPIALLCSEIFQRPECNTDQCPIRRMIHFNEDIKDEEVELLDEMGKLRTFLLSIIPLQMITEQHFFLMRFSDITTKKEYEKELTIYQKKLKEENVKLQQEITQMKITPVHEKPIKKTQIKTKQNAIVEKIMDLSLGTSYIFTDTNMDIPYNAFISQVHSGKLGLVISRLHPDKIRKKYSLKETPIVWVNNSIVDENKRYIQPNLQIILHLLKAFLKEASNNNEKSIILIDCLEYLTIYNEFKKIIQFYEVLSENIVIYNGTSITTLDPDAFDSKEFALLKRGSEILKKKK